MLHGERRWHFPSKRRGKEGLTATRKRGTPSAARPPELAGSRGWAREVSVFPTRREQASSCRGWSHYIMQNVGHSPWLPLSFLSSSLYLEPGHLNTACCTQGSGVLHYFQEPCTVHMDEDNMNTIILYLHWGYIYFSKNVNESPKSKLAAHHWLRFTCILLYKNVFR